MGAKPALAVVKKTLKPYRLPYYYQTIKLVTNPKGSWEMGAAVIENGWVTLDAGWLVTPEEFKKKHPGYCLFSRMEPYKFPEYDIELVESWLYTPTVHEIFKEAENREMFRCFVNPACLVEIPLV